MSLLLSTIATMGFLLFGYDRTSSSTFNVNTGILTCSEGVMSGIISDPAFNNMFVATKGDNTMQATVTAVYEVGRI